MIRCGSEFELVILVSPPEARPSSPGAKYYRYATWQIHDQKPEVFNEISMREALGYFSGHADGLGFEEPPNQLFESLDAALQYVREKRAQFAEKQLRRLSGLDGIER